MMIFRTSPFLIGILLVSWGCSSPAPSPTPSPPISVSIDRDFARVHVSRSVQFTATVRNSTNSAVTWSFGSAACNGAVCGMISSNGLYTAPESVPSPADVVVKAASVADPSKSATATVTILPAIMVTVSSPYSTVVVGGALLFSADVRNADNGGVNWTVSGSGCTGAGCGTIASTGFYRAPHDVPAGPAVTIMATSVEDSNVSGSATVTIVPSASSVAWAWMSGSDIVRANGEYGSQGTPAPDNVPGARERSIAWSDSSGGLWLFGGRGLTSDAIEGFLNDLWKFDPAAQEWTWMAGSNSRNPAGTYGTQGMADPSNTPGGRYESVSWFDPGGQFWLFGGYGIYTATGGWDMGNDLWKYDPVTGQWTWMSGSNGGGQAGVYGTMGLADLSTVPGARRGSVSWVDFSGALWLFGGGGHGSDSASSGALNDLWKFDPVTGQWTWMSGSDTINQPGVYGTKGMADLSNVPGARSGASSWIDFSGNLWLFGGGGLGSDSGNSGALNDLWKFDTTTHEWTWISGSDFARQAGVYGTMGLADPSNIPGGRSLALPFRDSGGNFWLFGGAGYDSTGENTVLNDLWMFDPATGEWIWKAGSEFGFQLGIYGTKGESDTINIPGARHGAVPWVDATGSFWLFGGWANDSRGNFSFHNDLWRCTR